MRKVKIGFGSVQLSLDAGYAQLAEHLVRSEVVDEECPWGRCPRDECVEFMVTGYISSAVDDYDGYAQEFYGTATNVSMRVGEPYTMTDGGLMLLPK